MDSIEPERGVDMEQKCSICKLPKEIVYQKEERQYCINCWEVVNAPYDLLYTNGKKHKKGGDEN
jgi:hypothetical protein